MPLFGPSSMKVEKPYGTPSQSRSQLITSSPGTEGSLATNSVLFVLRSNQYRSLDLLPVLKILIITLPGTLG